MYLAGKSDQSWQVAWLDSSGKMQPMIATPGEYTHPRFSPDGRKLTFVNGGDIFVHDLERDTTTRLTFSGGGVPVLAPDGKHLAFLTASGIFWIRSDGAGEPQRLLESQSAVVPGSFSPDGRRLAYFETNPETGLDIWTLPLDLADPDHPKAGKPEPFLRTPAAELLPVFSPDGRWIAYRSSESGDCRDLCPAFSRRRWRQMADLDRWRLVRVLVEQRARVILRNRGQPDHGVGLHGGRQFVRAGQAASVVGQADLQSGSHEPGSGAGWQALRGVPNAGSRGRRERLGPRHYAAELFRRGAAADSNGEVRLPGRSCYVEGEPGMPEVSRFFGIVVQMYYADHEPPHFHVRYSGQRALIAIETLTVLRGGLSPRALGLVTEWAAGGWQGPRRNSSPLRPWSRSR